MKKIVVLLGIVFLLIACETGSKYTEEDVSLKKDKVKDSQLFNSLFEGEVSSTPKNQYFAIENDYLHRPTQIFEGGEVTDGLNVKTIRKGRHHNYERLVFDVTTWREYGRLDERKVDEVGYYNASYNPSEKLISVLIHGYRNFSATLPTFPSNSIIEKIYLDNSRDEKGYKFHIKLKKATEVKIFDLKNPARMVFDIKSI